MKKHWFYIISVFIFSTFYTFAQESQGSLKIVTDEKIDQMMNFHKKLCTQNPGFKGYRVQIFFDSGNYSKDNAKQAEQKFNNIYPEQEVYLIFDEPYYKVRVGNFRTQVEAEGFLNKIIENYPEAFVVPDFVDFPTLYDENGEKTEEFLIKQKENIEQE